MATSVTRDPNLPGVIVASAGKNEATAAIELRGYSAVSVQVTRSGTVQTATIEVSNDGTNWVTARARQFMISEGAGEHVELTTLASGLYTLLDVARFARLAVSDTADGADDVLTATFNAVE